MSKSVALGQHLERFVEEQVARGRYNNESEVVRAGLRLLEKHELELNELRRMVDEGDRDYAAGRYVIVEDTRQLAAEIAQGDAGESMRSTKPRKSRRDSGRGSAGGKA